MSRLVAIAAGVALASAFALAGFHALQAANARADAAKVRTEFADYRATAERQAREALAKAQADGLRTRKTQQEAQDAEYLARQAAEADAAGLRAGNGQLQRYAEDLSTSLGDRARDLAVASGGPTAQAGGSMCPHMLGRLDEASAEIAQHADAASRAGQLCERSYDALKP